MDETLARILDLMKKQNLTAVGMEDYLEVPRGSFSNWKRGKGKSYYEHIVMIADKLEVPIEFLMRGTNETEALSGQEKALIEGFRNLSDEAKGLIEKNGSPKKDGV